MMLATRRPLTRAELVTPLCLSQDERARYVADIATYWCLGLPEAKRRLFMLWLIGEGRIGKGDRN